MTKGRALTGVVRTSQLGKKEIAGGLGPEQAVEMSSPEAPPAGLC